jgi:HK97 gp10 family phage protein
MSKGGFKVTTKLDDSGFKAGMAELKKLAGDEKTLQKVLAAGAHVVEAEAKINANQNFSSRATNFLANSIHVVIDGLTAFIGSNAEHARIRELGGIIKPVFAKMLHWKDPETGEDIYANVVHQEAKPYLRPAVDENMDKIKDAMAETIRREIEGKIK